MVDFSFDLKFIDKFFQRKTKYFFTVLTCYLLNDVCFFKAKLKNFAVCSAAGGSRWVGPFSVAELRFVERGAQFLSFSAAPRMRWEGTYLLSSFSRTPVSQVRVFLSALKLYISSFWALTLNHSLTISTLEKWTSEVRL